MSNNYYVDASDLSDEIKKYKESGEMSEDLGRMFLLIAKNLASKSNFSGYTWKDDMIGEAVLTCIKYIHNFDPDNPKANVFTYVTTICSRAFITHIRKQKKHSKIKNTCFGCKDIVKDDMRKNRSSSAINYSLIRNKVGIENDE